MAIPLALAGEIRAAELDFRQAFPESRVAVLAVANVVAWGLPVGGRSLRRDRVPPFNPRFLSRLGHELP
jgi:hypothetical protein